MKAPFSRRKVTAESARELDRAMLLLHRGRISFGRWVETLEAWCSGKEIGRMDFGDAETISERISVVFGATVTTPERVAAEFGLSYDTAYHALHRMSARRKALRLSAGKYRVL